MQPCTVCGRVGIDAAGYCMHCRTYLGPQAQVPPPQAQMPPPQQYPPVGAYGPTSAMPYPGQSSSPPYGGPSSAPPFGGPSSAPPYGGTAYPTSGYPGAAYSSPTSTPPSSYPGGAYQPPPPRNRSPFVIPLIALSGVLVVVVLAIVAVVIFRPDGSTPKPRATSLVDSCVVGTWTVASYGEDVAVETVGKVHFTGSGKGAEIRFGADGKGVQDYGSGTKFTASVTVEGQTVNVTLIVSGTIKYDYRTNDNTMSFSNVVANGKTIIGVADSEGETADLTGNNDPAQYTCKGNTMTTFTSMYRAEMRRKS